MAEIIDFYQYKYSRNNYYLNLALTKDKIINIKRAIEDGFEDLFKQMLYKIPKKSIFLLLQ